MPTKVRVLSGVLLPVCSSTHVAFVLGVLLAGLSLGLQPALAQPGGAKNRSAAAAEKLMAQGAAAITAKNFAAAQSTLTDAYRAYQSPLILYHLGALRAAEQKTVEAQDLLRRFLADSTVEPGEPLRQEAQKLLASLPAAEAGEVSVVAPRGSEVTVDGKVVGALPLPLPLLLSPGSHQVTVQQSKWRATSQAKVKTARLLELRFKAGSDVVVATEPPTVLVADGYPDAAVQDPLRQRISEIVRRENMAPLLGTAALGYARELGPAPACLADAGCQRRLAEKFGSDYLLSVKITRNPADPKSFRADLELLDLAVGAVAASEHSACDNCTPEVAAGKLGDTAKTLLSTATARGRGDIEITSDPTGAEVTLDGKAVGRTPLNKTVFTGSYELGIRKAELRPHTQRITVGPGDPLKVAVTLVPEGVEPPPPPPTPPVAQGPLRRARWRIATGAAALGVGALFVGLGASGLYVDQHCVMNFDDSSPNFPSNCDQGRYFDTQAPGLGLTISGAVLLVGGAVLIALPPSIGGERAPAATAQARRETGRALSLASATSF